MIFALVQRIIYLYNTFESEPISMFFAIVSAAVCLAVATMMYTPKIREFRFYRPMAFIFLFEGIWIIVDYIMKQLIPDNTFMMLIHYLGLIILCIYFALSVFFTSKKKTDKKNKGKKFD